MRRALALVVLALVAFEPAGEGSRAARPLASAGQVSAAVGRDFVRPGETAPLPAAVADSVSSLRAERLAAHIAFLSAPSLGGRGLGSDGLEAAADYVAAQLSLAGVAPAVARSGGHPLEAYFQPVPLREVRQPGARLTLTRRRGGGPTRRTVIRPGTGALFPERVPLVVQGPAVFAGYGIREERPARDDYKGLDVKGKVVVLLGGLPEGAEWRTPELRSRYDVEGRYRHAAKLALAGSLGARAVVAIEDEAFAAELAKEPSTLAPAFFTLAERETPPLPPVVRVTPAVGGQILAGAVPLASAGGAAPRALAGLTVSVELTGRERALKSRNVVAVVPGAHPSMKEEAVVLGAHMDHLGRQGTTYFPGADDNASGVAALLEIARAVAASPRPPARTLVFAFWTAEEEGHWGAEHYCRHPAWPLERTAAYLNLDMIGHPWLREEIEKLVADTRLERGAEFLAAVDPARFIELGLADWADDLGPVLLSAARGVGLALHLDRTGGRSGGSDYREFAWRGVKFVRFFGNYFPGYHEPIDRVETLDASQVLRVARLALASAWLVAERTP